MDIISENSDWLASTSYWVSRAWRVDTKDVYQDLCLMLLSGKTRSAARFLVNRQLAAQAKVTNRQVEYLDSPTHDESSDTQALAQLKLSQETWEIIRLKYIENCSWPQVAERTGHTVNRARYLATVGLSTLREALEN